VENTDNLINKTDSCIASIPLRLYLAQGKKEKKEKSWKYY